MRVAHLLLVIFIRVVGVNLLHQGVAVCDLNQQGMGEVKSTGEYGKEWPSQPAVEV